MPRRAEQHDPGSRVSGVEADPGSRVSGACRRPWVSGLGCVETSGSRVGPCAKLETYVRSRDFQRNDTISQSFRACGAALEKGLRQPASHFPTSSRKMGSIPAAGFPKAGFQDYIIYCIAPATHITKQRSVYRVRAGLPLSRVVSYALERGRRLEQKHWGATAPASLLARTSEKG